MADRSVKIILGADVGGVVSGMRTAKSAVSDFARSSQQAIQKNRADMDQLASATARIGAGLTALAGFAVKSAMDWETAWTGVLKTVDGTRGELNALEGDLRSLAKETGFAHAEVAGVAEAAGQLGISTGGVARFTETMLAMGVSTNLASEEAATGLARFRNIMGTAEPDIERMGSTIVGLGNNFATTEREILEMSLRIAGAGRQAGLTEADVMALATSMSSVGIEAEAGGTAMSLTMKRIGREVDTGGKKLALFAKTADMSVKDFRRSWKEDAAGTLVEFIKGLDKASRAGESVNGILSELGITGIREADAVLRLSGNYEGLADALDLASQEWESNAALMAEADKFYNTSAQQIKKSWAAIKDAGIDTGAVLLPLVSDLAEGVADLAGAYQSLPAPVKSAVGELAGTTGVTLLAVGGTMKLVGAVSDLIGAVDGMGRKAVVMRGASLAIGAALLTLADNAGEADRTLGTMMNTAGGMAVGFAVGGPWGAALGGAIGLIKGLTDASRDAAREVELLLSTFDQATGRMTEAARQLAVEGLNKPLKEGLFGTSWGRIDMTAFEAAKVVGIDLQVLTDAAMGSDRALAQVHARLDELWKLAEQGTLDDEAERLGVDFYDLADATALLGDHVDKNADSWMKAGQRARDAAIATSGQIETTKQFKAALEDVPKGVHTELKLLGYDPTTEQLDALIAKYELTPEQVQTVLAALDRATPLIEKVRAGLGKTDQTTATPTVNLQDNASSKLAGIGSQLSRLAGTAINTYINVIERKTKANADGGMFVGSRWKAYADGGIDEYGRRVQRYPQIRSGSQGTVVWGEPETGWEAYISGKPGKKERNRAIATEAVKRLGGEVQWFADGGFTEAMSSLELTRLRIRRRDLKRALAEMETVGKGDKKRKRHVLRGLDRREARQELREVEAELAEQRRIRKKIGKGKKYKTAGQYNREMRRREEARQEAKEQRKRDREEAKREAEQAREDRQRSAADFASGLDADAFKSPASLERHLARTLQESAEFVTLIAALRKAGASPWLLEQILRFGPSRATNRTLRALLADSALLARINTMSAGMVTVGNNYAALTSQSGFTPTWSGTATYNESQVIAALSRAQFTFNIDGRSAGLIAQVGLKHQEARA